MSETRKKIRNLIKSIKTFDDQELADQEDALKWIDSGEKIWRIEKPATPPKHLVVYTVLVDPKQHKVLLVNHVKSGLLLSPGGHPELGELPYETIPRELEEELGMDQNDVEVVSDPQIPFFISTVETVGEAAGHIDVDLWYLVKGDSTQKLTKGTDFDREFEGHRWMSYREILTTPIEQMDPNTYRLINKIINSNF